MKTLFLAFAITAAAFAQGATVNQTSGPPPAAVQKLFFYDASSNLVNVCVAAQNGASTSVSRSASTLTSIAVATNVATVTTVSAHGLYIGARVTVTGASVATALNATYTVATVPSTTTYTFTTSGAADGTYTEATLAVGTTNPLTTATRWAIHVFTYNVSNALTADYWANASVGYALACTSRTSY